MTSTLLGISWVEVFGASIAAAGGVWEPWRLGSWVPPGPEPTPGRSLAGSLDTRAGYLLPSFTTKQHGRRHTPYLGDSLTRPNIGRSARSWTPWTVVAGLVGSQHSIQPLSPVVVHLDAHCPSIQCPVPAAHAGGSHTKVGSPLQSKAALFALCPAQC